MSISLNRFIVVAVVACSAIAVAQVPTSRPAAIAPRVTGPDPASDQLLQSKGLTKVGNDYLLDVDAHLGQGLRQVRQAKKLLDDNTAARNRIEQQVKQANAAIDQLNRQLADVSEKRQTATGSAADQLGAQNNLLISKIAEAVRYREERDKELANLGSPGDDYVTAVINVSDQMEAAAKRYEELAADAEVKAAIAKINQTLKPPVKLGPSAAFAQELRPMRKLRESVNSGEIKLSSEGGVPHVTATINGTVTEQMVVDSGAAIVTVTADLARKLGLQADAGAEEIQLITADGQKTSGRVAHLKTVRVGQFTVENVECALLPADVKADSLLGGTFLKNFVYRMDLGAGVLHLSQIAGKPAAPTLADSRRSSSGTTPTTAPSTWRESEWLSHMVGDIKNQSSGAIVLKKNERIRTDRPFRPPITFKIQAKTDGPDIRFGYACDQMIFNWGTDPKQFRLDGGQAGGRHKSGGAGEIPTNQFVNFELTVLPDEMIVKVNGKERYRTSADFSKVEEPLSIFPGGDAVVTVRSVVPSVPTLSPAKDGSGGPFKQQAVIEITAKIDGDDRVTLDSSGAQWKHTAFSWPTQVTINGSPWDPKSKPERSSTDPALRVLQTIDFSTAHIIEKAGRDQVTLEKVGDGIEIKFSDPSGGTGQYAVKIAAAQK